MMKNFPRDWAIHGQFAQTELMAGVLPRHGVHSIVGKSDDRDAALAELATVIASTPATCSGASRFGLSPSGSASGVAIISGNERADSISRAVATAAMGRGVRNPIPVAVLGVSGVHLEGIHARINELSAWFEAEYGVGLGLVVIDLALSRGELLQFARQGRAALVVGNEAAAGADGVVVSVEADRLDVAAAAKPVVRKAAAKEPELPITSKVALIVARGEISTALRNRWTLQGFEVATSQEAALPKPGDIVGGRREIVIAGEDQRPEELRGRATRLREEAVRRGIDSDVLIRVAA
jgi:hypothetical protein